ncbi:glycosyltransferase family 39 protein [Desulfovibrio sp. JY]|nr:glycosyltransferase family 39 protein [Desulfovibrio sp. JY]
MQQTFHNTKGASRDWAERLVLAAILAVAACLRLYHLETPTMWWDEIVVPLTARFPVSYILDFSRHCEMHPPLYHLFIKAVEWAGISDFALRLPSALCGLAAVYAAWRLFGRLYDRAVGLVAAAFLAGSAMQVWHVRQVRPYAILTLLFVFSLYFCLRLIRERQNRDLYALLGINAVLLCLHYFMFEVVFAEGVVLVANWRPRGQGLTLRQLVVFCCGTAIVALPVLLIFFLPSQTTLSIFADKSSFAAIGRLIVAYAADVLWSHDDTAMRLFMGAIVALGGLAMARRAPRELAACLLVVLIPALILFFMRKTAYFSPRHFLYMTVVAALFAGQATRFLPRPGLLVPPAALLLAITAAANVFFTHPDAYYRPTSYHHPVFVTDFKPMARELAWRLRPGEVVAASDPGTVNAVSWYLDRFVAGNPFRDQKLDAVSPDFTLRFFAPFHNWGHLGKTEQAFTTAVGPISRSEQVLNAKIYDLPIHREPAPVIAAAPFHLRRRAAFPDFYRQVTAFSDMTINPYWGGEAIPTRNSRPAFLEYRIDNAAGDAPQQLQWMIEYKNQGRDSTMAFSARFDDEPAVPLFTSVGPDGQGGRMVTLVREKPYKTLTLRLETVCAPYTARYPGGNLETTAFRDFDLEIVPLGHFDSPVPFAVRVQGGLGKIEHSDLNLWRWGLGPQSELAFDLPQAGNYVLEFDFANVIPGQTVTVAVNGTVVETFANLPADARESRRIPIAGRQGHNTIAIAYSDWNHGKTTFAATDVRPMALFIRKLRLVPAK